MSYEKTNLNKKEYIWDYSDNESEEFLDNEDVTPILEQTHTQSHREDVDCQDIKKNKKHEIYSCDDEYLIRNDGDEPNKYKRRMFYIAYRTRQRLSGAIAGAIEGCATGMYIGGKWGGGGGWIMGGIMQGITIVVTPFLAAPICFILGLMSDRYTVMQLIKDYRYSIAAGGVPPTHGSFQ